MANSKINIRGFENIVDFSYRYKMAPVNTVSQKGKLVITNIKDISHDLTTQHTVSNAFDVAQQDKCKMLIEFLKKRFSTPIKCDKLLTKVELKGVSQDEIQNAVYEFIEYFIICPSCKNPETALSKEKTYIYMSCHACSHHAKINSNNKMISKLWDSYLKILS